MAKDKFTTHSASIKDAVSQAYSDLEELGTEMREAYDNTPESLQGAAIGEAREEAASALEGLSEPDVPDELKSDEHKVTWNTLNRTPKQIAKRSRADRRDDACAILDGVVQKLSEMAEDESLSEAIRDSASELQSEVENLKDEAEAVEFPGRNV